MAGSPSASNVVILICGLPGSGKTELLKEVCATLTNHYNLRPISYDNFITFSISDHKEWKLARQQLGQAIEQYIQNVYQNTTLINIEPTISQYYERIHKAWRNEEIQHKPNVFLLDDNFYYASMRHEWYQIAQKYQLGFGQIFLKCNLLLAKRRNSQRQSTETVPEHVIDKMNDVSEWPDVIEDKMFCHSLTMDSEDSLEMKISRIRDLINITINDPVQPVKDLSGEKEVSRTESSKNLIHQSDIILRRLISNILKGRSKSSNMNQIIPQISNIKQSVLMKLKNCEFDNIEQKSGSLDLEKLKEELEKCFHEEMELLNK